MAETVATAIANYAAEYLAADAIATYVVAYETIGVLQVVAVAYGYQQNAERQRKAAIAAHNASLQDRYLMVRAATEPRQIVLGRQRVSGPLAYVGSYGADREHLVFIVVLAAHECDAIEQVYFDDELVKLDGSGNVLSVNRRDLFSISTSSATFTLTSDPDPASVVAVVSYGSTQVTLGVSVSGRDVTVTGATSGTPGTVNITYQPAQSLFAGFDEFDSTADLTLNGSGTGSVTLPVVPVSGSVKVTGTTGTGQDLFYHDLATYFTVSGAVVTVTGFTQLAGGTVVVSYRDPTQRSRCRVRKYLGAAGQTADAGMIAALPGVWTSSHTMTSLCYLVIEADFDINAFPSGIMNVSAIVRGAKMYDPRTTNTTWSENPALMCRYVTLTPLLTRMTSDKVNDTYIAAAATVCDTSSSYVVNGRTYTRPLYTAGLTIKSGTRAKDHLDDLSTAMCGRWVFVDGQLRVKAGSYVTPVQTITDRWLHSGQSIRYQARGTRSDVFNAVTGKYVDEQRDYREADYPRVASSAYITEDGQELETQMQLNAVTFVGQCQQVVAMRMREARIGERLTIACNMRAYAVEVLDTIYVTIPRFGMTAEAYDVMDVGFSVDGGILLSLQRTDASVYALGSSFDAAPLPPNTRMASPAVVPAVAGLTLTSGTTELLRQKDGTILPRLLVQWTEPSDQWVVSGGGTEVRYGPAGSPEETWQSVETVGAQDRIYLTDVFDRAIYFVKVRHFNALVRGRWTAVQKHTMVGKSAPPANPTSVTATQVPGGVLNKWAVNTETDYQDTEIRSGASWAAGTLVWRGTADRYLLPWPAAGALTLWIAHRDTSGNYSATPVSVSLTVGNATLIGTPEIAPNAATDVATDVYDFAGSTFGTVVARSFTVTPTYACVMEFTAKVTATNILGDSGSTLSWWVTRSGSSDLLLGGSETNDTSKQEFTGANSFSAAAGVTLTFELRTQRASGNPSIALYTSYMRATTINR